MKRKTTIPVQSAPEIIQWLITNSTDDELAFMANIAGDRKAFAMLGSIITRLTDYNMHHVFYDLFTSPEKMAFSRERRIGEVAGLKAFHAACQVASDELGRREKQLR